MRLAILIAGPTGVGKSMIAREVAAELRGEIVNADSMQVYSDLRVLSARPNSQSMEPIAHHLYGYVDAAERYGLGRWLRDAADAASRIFSRRRVAIFVGGTGLYLTSLERGYVPRERSIRPLSNDELPEGWIKRGAYAKDQPSDLSGRKYLDANHLCTFVIERERAELYQRINENFVGMVANGAILEVNKLLNRGLDPEMPIMKALGVRELSRHILGEVSLDEAIVLGQNSSRKFARRQMTWFRNQMRSWRFVSADKAVGEIIDRVKATTSA
jgi:tRNA dimethylallyltransferase